MKIFEYFPNESRVWLYQTDRALTPTEMDWLSHELKQFVTEWAAHGTKLWADGVVVNPYFVAFAVDESVTPPSGCSIDSSVKFLKAAGKELGVDFFTRMKVCVATNDSIQQIDFHDFRNQQLSGEELIYDALISSLSELRTAWPRKVKESGLSGLIASVNS
jgi:hypothetical protein